MVSRRKILRGMAAATVLGMVRPLQATKTAGHFLKPGQKLHPGMSLMITDLAAGPETRSDRDFVIRGTGQDHGQASQISKIKIITYGHHCCNPTYSQEKIE
jgi:hypothetical protein